MRRCGDNMNRDRVVALRRARGPQARRETNSFQPSPLASRKRVGGFMGLLAGELFWPKPHVIPSKSKRQVARRDIRTDLVERSEQKIGPSRRKLRAEVVLLSCPLGTS